MIGWEKRRRHDAFCAMAHRRSMHYRTLIQNPTARTSPIKFRTDICRTNTLLVDRLETAGVDTFNDLQQRPDMIIWDVECLMNPFGALPQDAIAYSAGIDLQKEHRALLITLAYAIGDCSHLYVKHIWNDPSNDGNFIQQFVNFATKLSKINYNYLRKVKWKHYWDRLRNLWISNFGNKVKMAELRGCFKQLETHARQLLLLSFNGFVSRQNSWTKRPRKTD